MQKNNTKVLPQSGPKRRQRRNRKTQIARTFGPVSLQKDLSTCTVEYARAIVDPFDFQEGEAMPCIPDNVSIPSFKYKAQSRGTFVIGTSGVGSVGVNTLLPCQGPSVVTTLSTYAVNQTPILGDPGTTAVSTDSNFLFANTTNQFRLVGAGLRVRFTGTTINMSGSVLPYRSAFNADIASLTASGLLLDRSVTQERCSRNWVSAFYKPDQPSLFGYQTIPELFAFVRNGGVNPGPTNLLIAVFGGIPGQSFDYEFVQLWETIGASLPSITKSHSDAEGMGAVLSSLPTTFTGASKSILRGVLSVAKSSIMANLPLVIRGLGNYYMNSSTHQPQIGWSNSSPSVTDVD